MRSVNSACGSDFNVSVFLLCKQGKEIQGNDVNGALCIKKPWPGMARTIFGDHQRFLDTYYKPFPGEFKILNLFLF